MTRLTKLQANKLRDEGISIEVFTHATIGIVNVSELRNIILSSSMRDKLLMTARFDEMRRAGDGNMKSDQVLEWLIGQRELDEERIASLTETELNDPVIDLIDVEGGMTHTIVDGMHRLVGRFRKGYPTFQYYAFPQHLAPMLPQSAMFADIPWGTKDVVGDKLRDINTGEET